MWLMVQYSDPGAWIPAGAGGVFSCMETEMKHVHHVADVGRDGPFRLPSPAGFFCLKPNLLIA